MSGGVYWIIRGPEELDVRLDFLKQHLLEKGDWPIQLAVGRYRAKRSLSQNNLFWLWCGEAAEFFNRKNKGPPFTKDDMHDLFCHLFLGHEDRVIGSTVIENVLRGTSGLDTGEMQHFMEKVEAWCIDKKLLLTVPRQSEYWELKDEQTR